MNWLNLKTSQLREPAFIGSEPVARATWLCVLTYCVEQENGGRIVGARKWKDRQWQQTCGVMLSEVESADALLTWEDGDLVVWNYPHDKEEEVITKRATARENGRRGGRPARVNNPAETNGKPTLVSSNNQRCKAEGNGKGKEWEGNRKEKENPNGVEPSAPKSRKEPTGEHAEFIRRWIAEYPNYHDGEAYVFQGGKDGTHVARLLKSATKAPEEWQRLFVEAWKRPDLFNCKQAATIDGFVGRINQIRDELNGARKPATGSMFLTR